MIRRSVNISYGLDQEIIFKLAENSDEQNQALILLHEAYVKQGYMEPHPSGMRITPYHMLPGTLIPIVKKGKKVIATLSIVPRSPLGLPIEKICEIDPHMTLPDRAVEISALAVDQGESGVHGKILFPLMKYLYKLNVNFLKVDYEFIGIHPKMAPLYEALLLFETLENNKSHKKYSFVNDAPVVPLMFNLKTRKESFARVYGGLPKNRNLMEFFESESPSNFYFPKSIESHNFPQNNFEQFEDLFCKKTDVFNKLSFDDKKKLSNCHKENIKIYSFFEGLHV